MNPLRSALILAGAALCLGCVATPLLAATQPDHKPTVFIDADKGFDTDITAAFEKKKTPVAVIENKDKADYVLSASEIQDHPESTGSKIARCLFIYCAGMEGTASVSVKMIKSSDQSVVWAYQVRKGLSGPQARQSLSEAIAKHLKQYFADADKQAATEKKTPTATSN